MKLDTWLDKTYKLRAETAVGPKVMWGDGKKHGINEIYFNKCVLNRFINRTKTRDISVPNEN